MRALVLIMCLIECMLAQNEVSFQFATVTSTSALAQSTQTQTDPLLEGNILTNNAGINALGIQDASQISCTPGVLIGTFDFIGIFSAFINSPKRNKHFCIWYKR